jgi:hypothetical protein
MANDKFWPVNVSLLSLYLEGGSKSEQDGYFGDHGDSSPG